MEFWYIAAALSAVVAILLLLALLRGRAADAPAASYDLQVYRDQLREVDRDLARGIISAGDAERVRLEISRKVLDADRSAHASIEAGKAPRAMTWIVGGASVVLLLAGSLALYDRIGTPGYPDLPLQARKDAADEARKTRPSQAEAEAMLPPAPAPTPAPRDLALVEKLRAAVKDHPNQQHGLALLTQSEAALGNFKEAYQAQTRLIALKQGDTTSDDYAMLADLLVLAAGGFVSPEAEVALEQSLSRDQSNGTSRFNLGLLYAQTGRPDVTFRIWRALLDDSPPDAPWLAPIRANIEEMAYLAGVDYTPPPAAADAAPALRGPAAGDAAAAADMTPEQRSQMIRGMVQQLNDRLTTKGGSPAEWAQLINALTMLDETDRATAIWGKAQQVFSAEPEALATVQAAARKAGLIE